MTVTAVPAARRADVPARSSRTGRVGRLVFGAVVPLLLLLTGCTASGMGWIPSNDVVDKATFGFSFDAGTSTLSGSYHDPRGTLLAENGGTGGIVDVAFKGTGVMHDCTGATDPACKSAPPSKGGCIGGVAQYTSQNPVLPGGGQVDLTLCDLDGNGVAGTGEEDFILIIVLDGPYTGYRNQGNPSGDITVKS